MFRVFRDYPKKKVVYIAPMKALVRERMNDWQERLHRRLVIKNGRMNSENGNTIIFHLGIECCGIDG